MVIVIEEIHIEWIIQVHTEIWIKQLYDGKMMDPQRLFFFDIGIGCLVGLKQRHNTGFGLT